MMNRILCVALKSLLMACSVGAISLAESTDLRVYPSFAEVREAVNAEGDLYRVQLPEEVWDRVIPDSIALEGLKMKRAALMLSSLESWLRGQEGNTMILRRGETEQVVTLVRASDLLVKNESGRYFRANINELAFSQMPPQTARHMDIYLANGGKGTLSYLLSGLSWQPKYTLWVGEKPSLQAWASIKNDLDIPYISEKTELYSGEVRIETPLEMEMPIAPAPAMMRSKAADAIETTSLRGGGVQQYRLGAVNLPPNSTVAIPLMSPTLDYIQRVAFVDNYFSGQPMSGDLERIYRFRTNDHLPAGTMTVRESGRVVGQVQMPETPSLREVNLNLGSSGVGYTREIKLLSESIKQGQRVRSYRVTYTFLATNGQPDRLEVRETLGAGRTLGDHDRSVTESGGVVRMVLDWKALQWNNGKAAASFVVHSAQPQ